MLIFQNINIAFKLLKTYKSKIRSILMLTHRNKNSFKGETFKKYMKAPCGRQVVKISLQKISKQSKYKELKRQYPMKIISLRNEKAKVIYYSEGKILNADKNNRID